jgi:hypothetical protein
MIISRRHSPQTFPDEYVWRSSALNCSELTRREGEGHKELLYFITVDPTIQDRYPKTCNGVSPSEDLP